MARVLIVGCGCRGAVLADRLVERGHLVRATTRRPERLAELEARGLEAARADPARLGTIMPVLEGVSVLCWLMASADGPPEAVRALHGDRLSALLETLVDTHVRGFVYERAGSVDEALLEEGQQIAQSAEAEHRIRLAMIGDAPDDLERWLDAAVRAVDDVLAA